MYHSRRRIGKAWPVSPEPSDLPEAQSEPARDGAALRYLDAIPDPSLRVRAVALMDIELRTAVACLVAASAIPGTVLRRSGREHREAVRFYARLAQNRNAEEMFPSPPRDVEVRVQPLGRLRWAPSVLTAEAVSFKSPYRVRYAKVRSAYEARKRNSVARAMHWRHDDGPRPTIIVVHGFTGSPYWFNSGFFSLPWVYGHGCDVMIVTLPFHGRRNDRGAPYSGSGLFSGGIATLNEAMFQSICDLRVIVDYLRRSGVGNVGITGLSLGGYLAALMAAAEPRLHVAIPNAPVTDLAALIDSWFPAGHLVKLAMRASGIPREDHVAAMSVHSPLSYPVRLPRDHLYIIGGLADRLAPPEQSARLWEHWGGPRIHWFPGSHILHVGRATYLREMGRFLRSTGFSPG
jgi:pimeloyl-ACP methyl ester carboxylesterase